MNVNGNPKTQNGAVRSAGAGLPHPRRGSRWRWAAGPRNAVLAGGAVATVLGVGASVAGAATTASSRPPSGAHGRPPAGARPTVAGRITALRGADITVGVSGKTTAIVVYSSGTTFKSVSGPNGASTTSSAPALKVGALIAVNGTKNSDGSVTASSIVIGGAPPGRPGGPGGRGPGQGGTPPAGAPSA